MIILDKFPCQWIVFSVCVPYSYCFLLLKNEAVKRHLTRNYDVARFCRQNCLLNKGWLTFKTDLDKGRGVLKSKDLRHLWMALNSIINVFKPTIWSISTLWPNNFGITLFDFIAFIKLSPIAACLISEPTNNLLKYLNIGGKKSVPDGISLFVG